MNKTNAVIRKENGKWNVYSESGKHLGGPYSSRQEAVKRLQQIEYFKHKGKGDMAFEDKFEEAMNQFGEKSEGSKLSPDPAGRPKNESKDSNNKGKKGKPLPKDPAGGKTKTDLVGAGTLAGIPSLQVTDNKDHLPIRDENEAKSAILRLSYMQGVPSWFDGTEKELKTFVLSAVAVKYPDLTVNINVSPEIALANVIVKDPNKNEKHVKNVPTPTLDNTCHQTIKDSYASLSEVDKKVLAGYLKDILQKRSGDLKKAMKLATDLEENGLTEESFGNLSGFLQEDILRELLMKNVSANRRQTILSRVIENRKNEGK